MKLRGTPRLITADNQWGSLGARDGMMIAELNGVLFRLGGWNSAWPAPGRTTNHFQASFNRGRTWTDMPTPPFDGRHTFGFHSFRGKLIVLGGDVNRGKYHKDSWSWSWEDGWECLWEITPPLAQGRVLFMSCVNRDRLFIIGGQTVDELVPDPTKRATKTGGPYYKDIWSCEDLETWDQMSDDNPWAPFGLVYGDPVCDDDIYMVGGGAYDTAGLPRVYKSSVWKTGDGTTSELITPDAGFIPCHYNSVVNFHGELVKLFGYNANYGGDLNEIFVSDGSKAVWRNTHNKLIGKRHAATVITHKSEILVQGGPIAPPDNNVWGLT